MPSVPVVDAKGKSQQALEDAARYFDQAYDAAVKRGVLAAGGLRIRAEAARRSSAASSLHARSNA